LEGRNRLEKRIKSLRGELSSALAEEVALEHYSNDAVSGDGAASTADNAYDRVVRDLPGFIARETEAGSTILVVSKGDDRLLRVQGRTGWHFPRAADGRYAGYHPEDSEDAIAHLERLRRQGAGYIVFPQTSLWWLEHYSALKRHLGEYGPGRTDAVGVVFDVRVRVAVGGDSTVHTSTKIDGLDAPYSEKALALADQPMRLVTSVVDGLLPDDATLAVTTTQSRALFGLPPERTAVVVLDDNDDDARVLASVEKQVAAGTEFLVVPHQVYGWLADRPSIAFELRARYCLVTRQAHFCEIYDLRHDLRKAGRML